MPNEAVEELASGFRGFLTKLKSVNLKTPTEEVASLLKQSRSGVRSVDDALASLPVVRERHGWPTIASRPIGYVNRILREGNLDALIALASRKIPIGSADRKLFSQTVGSTPEKSLKEVSDVAAATKRTHARLDVPADQVSRLDRTAFRDMKQVESNLFKYFKQGSAVALTIGVAYVAIDWIAKATVERKGCFMLTTLNGRTTSCKVAAYSCAAGSSTGASLCASVGDYYNVTLCLMTCATMADTDARKIRLCEQLGVKPAELSAKLPDIVDTQFAKASETIAEMQATKDQRIVPNICGVTHPQIESGKVPECRMCSPSDNPLSTTFIDQSQYADNITFRCVTNPSILDTIADATISTGKNLWEGVTSGLSSAIKTLLVVVGVVLGLLVLLGLALRFLMSRRDGV